MIKNWFSKKNMENKDITSEQPNEAQETTLSEDIFDIENTEETTTDSELDNSASKIRDLEAQIVELKNKVLYQQAEFENFRKRTQREKSDILATAARDTMSALLPVLDDFERASKNETFTEGVNLVWQKLASGVRAKGLKEMETPVGCDFNPDEHEAITEIPAGEAQVGKVVDTLEKGYLLNDRIVRYAKVVVGK
jgi:molecular chaperone GrpE